MSLRGNVAFEIIISILLCLLIPILGYKAFIRRDWSIVASIVPRIYLLYIVIHYLVIKDLNIEYIHLGVLAVFATDIFVNLIYLLSRKYTKTLNEYILANQLKLLQDKYIFLVEESPIGKYVLNSDGTIEFVNKTLADILETTKDKLIGKHFESFAAEDSIPLLKQKFQEKLDNPSIKTDYQVNLKTATGKLVRVRLISKRTENGHTTILGSVLLM